MEPTFWDDSKAAEKVLQSIKSKKVWTEHYDEVVSAVDDVVVMYEFFQSGDPSEA